jgi:hypothetical protein
MPTERTFSTVLARLERSPFSLIACTEVFARAAPRCPIVPTTPTERTFSTVLARLERSPFSLIPRAELFARATARTLIAVEPWAITILAEAFALAAIGSRRWALIAGWTLVAELSITEFLVAAPRTCRTGRTIAPGAALAPTLVALTRSTARRTAVVFIVVAGHE